MTAALICYLCSSPGADRAIESDDEHGGFEHTEIRGVYKTFAAARDAARGALARGTKEAYKYYKESQVDDGESAYSAVSDEENEQGNEPDEDEEDFCIRTYHEHGKEAFPHYCRISAETVCTVS